MLSVKTEEEFWDLLEKDATEEEKEGRYEKFLEYIQKEYIEKKKNIPDIFMRIATESKKALSIILSYIERKNQKRKQEKEIGKETDAEIDTYVLLFSQFFLLTGKRVEFIHKIFNNEQSKLIAPLDIIAQKYTQHLVDGNKEDTDLEERHLLRLCENLGEMCIFLHPGIQNKQNLISIRQSVIKILQDTLVLAKKHQRPKQSLEALEMNLAKFETTLASLLPVKGENSECILKNLEKKLALYDKGEAFYQETCPEESANFTGLSINRAIARLEAREELRKIFSGKTLKLNEDTTLRDFIANQNEDILTLVNGYVSIHQNTEGKNIAKDQLNTIKDVPSCIDHFVLHYNKAAQHSAHQIVLIYQLISHSDISIKKLQDVCSVVISDNRKKDAYIESMQLKVLESIIKKLTQLLEETNEQKTNLSQLDHEILLNTAQHIWDFLEKNKRSSDMILKYTEVQYYLGFLYASQKEKEALDKAMLSMIFYQQLLPKSQIEEYERMLNNNASPTIRPHANEQDYQKDLEKREQFLRWEKYLRRIGINSIESKFSDGNKNRDQIEALESPFKIIPFAGAKAGLRDVMFFKYEYNSHVNQRLLDIIEEADKEMPPEISTEEFLARGQKLLNDVGNLLFANICQISLEAGINSYCPLEFSSFRTTTQSPEEKLSGQGKKEF